MEQRRPPPRRARAPDLGYVDSHSHDRMPCLTTFPGSLQFFELWFLVGMNMSKYQTGSALIATGMTYWQAIIVIIIGNVLAASFAVLNSISGAESHLGFPVVSRTVWGECPFLTRRPCFP
jgi:nucleobase:cation symporter-1, NCS1 family